MKSALGTLVAALALTGGTTLALAHRSVGGGEGPSFALIVAAVVGVVVIFFLISSAGGGGTTASAGAQGNCGEKKGSPMRDATQDIATDTAERLIKAAAKRRREQEEEQQSIKRN